MPNGFNDDNDSGAGCALVIVIVIVAIIVISCFLGVRTPVHRATSAWYKAVIDTRGGH